MYPDAHLFICICWKVNKSGWYGVLGTQESMTRILEHQTISPFAQQSESGKKGAQKIKLKLPIESYFIFKVLKIQHQLEVSN